MPIISSDDVRYIAALTHLHLTEGEIEVMRSDLSTVLEHFESLQRIDTTEVEPTGHSTDVRSVMRDDEPSDSLSRKYVLANVPEVEDDYFRIRPILG